MIKEEQRLNGLSFLDFRVQAVRLFIIIISPVYLTDSRSKKRRPSFVFRSFLHKKVRLSDDQMLRTEADDVVLAQLRQDAGHRLSRRPGQTRQFDRRERTAYVNPILPRVPEVLHQEVDRVDDAHRRVRRDDLLDAPLVQVEQTVHLLDDMKQHGRVPLRHLLKLVRRDIVDLDVRQRFRRVPVEFVLEYPAVREELAWLQVIGILERPGEIQPL